MAPNNDTPAQGGLLRLRSIYPSLTAAEQRAATYILENPGEIIHLSITELAEQAQTAEATIFRLCKRLGYRGFQAFKIALASEMVDPVQNIHEDVQPSDDMLIIAHKVFQSNVQCLQETLKIQEKESLEQAVEMLLNARRVEFYGSGGSGAIAMDAYHKFMRTGIWCQAHTDAHLQVMAASLLGPGDVAVGISHTGANKDVYEALKIAREAGARTIGITNFMKSPLTRVTDICLFTSARETRFRSEAMSSRISQLAIIDSLVVGVSLRRQDEALSGLQKIRRAIANKRF
ncbi:MurR/RpiR family transcriptional regulator [Neomoorella mulderi]|uniref:Putative HTH-type transcriptional regulator YbbH n=1 Tax=Moorella mulderi DSM 14980 TaxID=1122241 RepID=A0A151B0D8_9FIRM|nr:MurR/RpiR family transcriptional regulator [Moorella mulderi]KYH33107.1 putative HTH-type transcriptional regulator YbbH [Moorella mulderi DSM 14980]